MPKLVTYHPTLYVKKGQEVWALKLALDDWYDDDEALSLLAEKLDSVTLGEALEKIPDVGVKGDRGIISARITKDVAEAAVARVGGKLRYWDEIIGP